MTVSNKNENIKQKNTDDAKKVFKPKSMFDLAREENEKLKISNTQKTVIKQSFKPKSMFDFAREENEKQKITEKSKPVFEPLKSSDFKTDLTPDDIEKIKADIKALYIKNNGQPFARYDENGKQIAGFKRQDIEQNEDDNSEQCHEIIPENHTETITEKDDHNWFSDNYKFGEHGHGEHHGKRENLKIAYEMQLNDYKKRAILYRNRALFAGLEDFANSNDYRATFLTITCNRDNVMQSKQCVTDIWNALQKHLKKLGVANFGIKSLEQQKSGIYHIHAIVFTPSHHTENMEKNVYPRYANHPGDAGESVKRITKNTALFACKYITKAYVTNDYKNKISKFKVTSESRFFGLPKGIIKQYDDIYKCRHIVNTYDDNELTNGERKQLAHIKKGLTDEQRKQMNKERYVKLHIQKKNMVEVLNTLGCFQKLKKCVCFWLSNEKQKINGVNFCMLGGQSKNQGNCRLVDKSINIIKKITQKIRGPPLAKITQSNHYVNSKKGVKIMNMNRSHEQKRKTQNEHITGIPPPCHGTIKHALLMLKRAQTPRQA